MTLKYIWRLFSLGCHFHVHFSYPWHAFASHGLPAISELFVVIPSAATAFENYRLTYCIVSVNILQCFGVFWGASQLVTRPTPHSPNFSDELTVWRTDRVTSWLWRVDRCGELTVSDDLICVKCLWCHQGDYPPTAMALFPPILTTSPDFFRHPRRQFLLWIFCTQFVQF